ncbi:2-hydroxyacid dehydrogenase [Calorimonas adulescens]|uniref:Phosphoglycerate dehydrogenase n=1 Tax=Calorimonas adulescens TaxID=2606906 RepID=A0A5D8QDL7_9THEO|nr:phosphoglycerate dehydrogenase [Calorimonas adulescens]TZE82780.1 phosphoglycerate dehydrogenase [Calorimonas adulescens]
MKVLITSKSFGHGTDGVKRLKEMGLEVLYDYNELSGADICIAGNERCSRDFFEAAKNLKLLCRRGTGIDNIDVKEAHKRGIIVTRVASVMKEAVAELTFALMLILSRKLLLNIEDARNGRWGKMMGVDLSGKTIGIAGMGEIGREVARRANAFNMNIIYYNRSRKEDVEKDYRARYVNIEELMSSADFITLHLPLGVETMGIINADRLNLMKRTSYLINVGRGALVDEEALYYVLEEGRIAGAASDVFINEPPVGSPLLRLPNFVPTPHIGSATIDTAKKMDDAVVMEIDRFLKGESNINVV